MTMRLNIGTSIRIALALLAGGCASHDSDSVAGICPAGLTYSCTSKVGRTQQCTCASREDLKDILDPVNDY